VILRAYHAKGSLKNALAAILDGLLKLKQILANLKIMDSLGHNAQEVRLMMKFYSNA